MTLAVGVPNATIGPSDPAVPGAGVVQVILGSCRAVAILMGRLDQIRS